MPAEDDGSRDDPLLSDRSWAVTSYRPDVDALAAAPTRIVIAVGEESEDAFTGRTAVATAELLGQQATVFPSHHGGFLGGEFGYAGQPEAFARKLREVLDDDSTRRAGGRQARDVGTISQVTGDLQRRSACATWRYCATSATGWTASTRSRSTSRRSPAARTCRPGT